MKKGDLVKAWDDDINDFTIVEFHHYEPKDSIPFKCVGESFVHAVEIPLSVVDVIKGLGK